MKDIMNVNYDDYYKFLVSVGILGIILLFLGTIYLNNAGILKLNIYTHIMSLIILFFFIRIICLGLKQWKKRQIVHDKILKIEYETKYNTLELLKLDINRKKVADERSRIAIKKYGGVPILEPE